MPLSFQNAVVYDLETLPNCFTCAVEFLNSDQKGVYEISEFRDDRVLLMQLLHWLAQFKTPMIGFNNLHFDYPILHALWKNPQMSYSQLYDKSQQIINADDSFGHQIWDGERFTPQVDLRKLQHLDNKAKMTSLKALQVNMRSESVLESSIPFGVPVRLDQMPELVTYNFHDVSETKKFAHFSMGAIEFRQKLEDQFGIDVYNWNDTKIGEQMIIYRLGEDVCYYRDDYGRKRKRQTPRHRIAFADIIFPYVRFESPEFNGVLDYLRKQVLTAEQIKDVSSAEGTEYEAISTKGVLTGLTASVGGITYYYGVGGIHGSVERKIIRSGGGYVIRDIDVASLYPSIAIVNNLAPAHLGGAFSQIYAQIPLERKKIQKEKGKKAPEANALKLAANGAYGKSNSEHSPLYDPQFTMSITVNGQLLLSMLIEQLIKIPTVQVIQANTDGITYFIHENYIENAKQVEKWWQDLTKLTLEDASYQAMFIRDVNNYIAVSKDGSVKLKGAYWTPDPINYHQSIADAQPVAWYKNFSNVVSTRAAVAHMTQGVDIETYIRFCTNPFDFMNAVKIPKTHTLLHGEIEQQKNTRFYVSTDGKPLTKRMPGTGPVGTYKKANGVSQQEYDRVMRETGGQWDERVCTKNKGKYEIRETGIIAGKKVTICNHVRDFRWDNIDYAWYVEEAKKLLI